MMSSPRTEKATASLNHQINVSIKETIEANIEDIREKIEMQAKTIKTLLREALAHSRAQHTASAATTLSPTRLQPEDFQRMDDEMSEHSRVIDQYIIEL